MVSQRPSAYYYITLAKQKSIGYNGWWIIISISSSNVKVGEESPNTRQFCSLKVNTKLCVLSEAKDISQNSRRTFVALLVGKIGKGSG